MLLRVVKAKPEGVYDLLQTPSGITLMTLISREPWWLEPPKPGQKEQDLHWGYLEIYADGRTVFVDQRPTDQELAERKSCRNFPDADQP